MLPSAPFDPTQSIFGNLSVIQLKIGEQLVVFEAAQLDDDPEQEVKHLPRPNRKGRLYNARSVETKASEKWTFGLDEVKRLLEIFGGKLRGRITCQATLWIPDPDDADGKCALKSEDNFDCVVSRDGKVTFGNSEFSKATIKIESLKSDDVTWTADAIVIDPPVITVQPMAGLNPNEGSFVFMSVTATGADTYQWRKDGVNISGATNANYSIQAVEAVDAGSYTCAVTNAAGTVISTAFVLNVAA